MIACYCRVSTVEQSVNGYSIDEQAERLKKYCDAMGWKNSKVYTDAGFSGAKTDRPALQSLIKDVEAKKVEKVIVYKLDRLSRSQLDTLYLIDKVFIANDCNFVSMTENFDTSTPLGRAMLGIMAVFAQLEREQIKERMLMGREARSKSGLYHGGGKDPIGYEYKNGELSVIDFEAMQVRELFEMYVTGWSMGEIQREFIKRGYSHRHGIWTIDSIRRTIQSPLYIGKIRFDGKFYDGKHEAIIDEDVYEAANRRMNERKTSLPTFNQSGRARSHYLGGLIYCARCGAKYGVWTSARKINYFSCYSRKKGNKKMIIDPNCNNAHWREDKLNEIVLGEIAKLALDQKALGKKKKVATMDDREKLIRKEIDKVEKRRNRLLDLYAGGSFDVDELDDKVRPLNETLESLKKQLETVEADVSDHKNAAAMIKTCGDIIKRGNYAEIRTMIEALVEKIVIDGEDVTIYWRFS